MGFTSSDDLMTKLTLGQKYRLTLNKITNAGFALVAGRCYDLSTLAGTPTAMGYGEHLINSYAPTTPFNWTANGTGYTLTAGVFAKVSGTATTLSADSLNIQIISGRFYRVQYTISVWTSSNVNFTLGGATGTARAAIGTYVEYITASSTAGFVLQASVNTGAFSVTNISVVEWGSATLSTASAFKPLTDATTPAVYHGGNVSPSTKHLLSTGIMTTAATGVGQFYVVDLLGCYPYIDCGVATTQTFVNTNTLPRYTSGAGVKAFMVSGGSGYANANSSVGAVAHNVSMVYTNQSGVGSRQMPVTVACTASAAIGHITHSGVAANNYFPLPLANNDNGVSSIQSVTLSTAPGAATYYHMVLYKELAMIPAPTANVYFERDFVNMMPSLEQLQDGAVLGLIYVAGGATGASTTFLGHIDVAWG